MIFLDTPPFFIGISEYLAFGRRFSAACRRNSLNDGCFSPITAEKRRRAADFGSISALFVER